MAEPKTIANNLTEVVPGFWHWSIHNEQIDFQSDSYAVKTGEGMILIDPVQLRPELLKKLEPISAIILTCGSHQRSAWRYRKEFQAPVYAPTLSKEIEEEPDHRYGDGDELPGNLKAVFTPGAGTTQHTLLHRGEPKFAICPDLLVRNPDGSVEVIPEEYAHDIELAKKSIKKLLNLPFSILCLSHGGPMKEAPKEKIRAALS